MARIELELGRFRAPNGERLLVDLYAGASPDERHIQIGLHFIPQGANEERYQQSITVYNRNRYSDEDLNTLFEQGKESLNNLVYEFILTGNWKKGNQVPNSSGNTYRNEMSWDDPVAKRLEPAYGSGFTFRLSPSGIIALSKMARKYILDTIFHAGRPVPKGFIKYESFLPNHVIEEEFERLSEQQLIQVSPTEQKFNGMIFKVGGSGHNKLTAEEQIWNEKRNDYHCRLTANGQRYFERLYSGFGRTIFVIKQCGVNEWLDALIEEIMVNEHGWDKPYIQEKEEPTGEIRADIIEHISNAPFLIVDLTGGRENCLYELGYAHALNKRTIITRSKTDLEKTTSQGETIFKATFDINQYKHSAWTDKDDSEFKAELRKRISQTIKAIEQDYLSI